MLSSFIDEITEPSERFLSPKRMCDALRIPMGELSRVIHVHRNTLPRRPDSETVQARLGEIARIISLASELVGDKGKAIVWFRHQPLRGFDNETAEDLVEAGHAGAVLKHLKSLSDGVYG